MPIKPENLDRYPAEWKQIRERILHRAGQVRILGAIVREGKCENCGAENHRPHPKTAAYVVLTVAHLDHTPEHCGDDNLRAWCQRCHNRYDREHRNGTARATRRLRAVTAGQMEMPL